MKQADPAGVAPDERPPAVVALTRFSLTSADAEALAGFYERAFDCRRLHAERRSGPAFQQLMCVAGGAQALTLALGSESIELLQFDSPGQPYPRGASAAELIFQHFAILVTDMHEAFRRLSATPGWTAISRDGPQRLPQSAGNVIAFKFRDPEGHPLELLDLAAPPAARVQVPRSLWSGIDHSAISVGDTTRSVAFYAGLGLSISASSFNSGVEQERLDGIDAPRVEVTALSAPQAKPHLELLCYRWPKTQPCAPLASNDVAATRLIFRRAAAATPAMLAAAHCIDPDGHHLIIE